MLFNSDIAFVIYSEINERGFSTTEFLVPYKLCRIGYRGLNIGVAIPKREIRHWCRETIGASMKIIPREIKVKNLSKVLKGRVVEIDEPATVYMTVIHFSSEADFILFKLRWL